MSAEVEVSNTGSQVSRLHSNTHRGFHFFLQVRLFEEELNWDELVDVAGCGCGRAIKGADCVL